MSWLQSTIIAVTALSSSYDASARTSENFRLECKTYDERLVVAHNGTRTTLEFSIDDTPENSAVLTHLGVTPTFGGWPVDVSVQGDDPANLLVKDANRYLLWLVYNKYSMPQVNVRSTHSHTGQVATVAVEWISVSTQERTYEDVSNERVSNINVRLDVGPTTAGSEGQVFEQTHSRGRGCTLD